MSDKKTNTKPGPELGDLVERRKVSKGSPVALVIDDNPDCLRIARAMLAHLGYAARAASTPDEAIHLLMDDAPALLVVDICLPMMDGISLIKLVRRMRDLNGVPLVALSGVYPSKGQVQQALAAQGIYAFLSKPYTVASLRQAVDFAKSAALRQGSPPACTMEPGGLWDAEDAADRVEREAREHEARRRGAPRALPASPRVKKKAIAALPGDSKDQGPEVSR